MDGAEFEWANVALTAVNVALTGFTAWVGYQVWKATRTSDLPRVEYTFHQARPGEHSGLQLTVRNQSASAWIVEGATIKRPRRAYFLDPIPDPADRPGSPGQPVGYIPSKEVSFNWEIGPIGSRGNGMVAGTSATMWHHLAMDVPIRGTVAIQVRCRSREARSRRSTEIIKIRLQAETAKAQS